ncbi:MAG: aldehyde oxidoreductase molybdenum-binding subunit PaoC [Pseudomonadota bacterium]
MKFERPATQNPIDQLKVIGKPVDRIEGRLKTTGAARYAYERHDVATGQAYGYVVGSAIAKGSVAPIDITEAAASPGVIAIVTAQNAGPIGKTRRNPAALLGGPAIDHYHQAIAIVVAETFENARAAARLIRPVYVRAQGRFDLSAAIDTARPAPEQADIRRGNFEQAFAAAAITLDESYSTPDQSHAMMEPHASIAAWDGDELSIWTSSQMIDWWRSDLAEILGMPKDKIRLASPYIGGGFGGKLYVRADAVLAALAARAARRPVKVALPRPLMINNTTHRPATRQRIRIGASADGRITAIGHEGWCGNLAGGGIENVIQQTRWLYAGEHRLLAMRKAALDLPEGNDMRAPGEAPGMMALEVAMDEMAEKLGLDPVAFRILNDTRSDPENPDRPFSQRQLKTCLELGAARFGWGARKPAPGVVRDGRWLIGMGVAAGYRNNLLTRSAARVRLTPAGTLIVETDMTDIGTGSYTILAQTAAEMMGLPIEKIQIRLGDSRFPVSCGSGGQWGANNATAGLFAACSKLRDEIVRRLALDPGLATFAEGHVSAGARRIPLRAAARTGEIVAEDQIEYGDLHQRFQQSTFAGHFCEIAVDSATGEMRIRRMLSVCAAGRILNPKTARSQVIGAMTMAAGAALMEELAVDKRFGFFVNHDLAGYEVPVHADIPQLDVIFLDEPDPVSSPMKAKGVGELGLCGTSAAIANAIYNATGARIRDYPITLDKLIERLPEMG